MRGKKAQNSGPAVWFIAMLLIFTIGIIYITMSVGWDAVYDKFQPGLPAEHQATATRMNSIWSLWPLVVTVGIIIWAFIMQSRNNPGTNGY